MKKLQWESNLSVGIELIDDQHRKWIDHFNSAVEAVQSRQGSAQISKTLDFLLDYTGVHFSTEEKHMSQASYPGLGEHKGKHDELRGTLANLVQDFEEEGVTQALVDSIDTFLGNWLIKHIQEVDMQFGAYVKEKGIVVSEE
jgi:hemerythrin